MNVTVAASLQVPEALDLDRKARELEKTKSELIRDVIRRFLAEEKENEEKQNA